MWDSYHVQCKSPFSNPLQMGKTIYFILWETHLCKIVIFFIPILCSQFTHITEIEIVMWLKWVSNPNLSIAALQFIFYDWLAFLCVLISQELYLKWQNCSREKQHRESIEYLQQEVQIAIIFFYRKWKCHTNIS